MKKLSIIAIFSLLVMAHINVNAADKGAPIRYLISIDYLAGEDGKQRYLKWVKDNVEVLTSFEEAKSITAYDNYYGVTPHRIVEFNFADMQSAAKYWSYPAVYKILQDLPNHSSIAKIGAFIKRGEYVYADKN
ncbi:hypothetical protein SPONL_2262 [uncultured Candidatus Thioglobus sp.]|nr:hypothetical protein SPONL_2262 [uncultured Candidatus Thioglobus sp.]